MDNSTHLGLVLLLASSIPAYCHAQALEPPLSGGFCDGRPGDCAALRVGETLSLAAEALAPGSTEVLVDDDARALFDGGNARGVQVDAAVPDGFVYSAVRVGFRDGDRESFTLEVYTLERSELEAWLTATRERVSALARTSCAPGEMPVPVHALRRDLDGDGVPEGLTTVGSSLTPMRTCRWTNVHTTSMPQVTIGHVAHGWPYVQIVELPAPDGQTIQAISSHYECCDLSQSFAVRALGRDGLFELFNNHAAVVGGRSIPGYGMWHELDDGTPVIAFTADADLYNYGSPATLEGFAILRFDGETFREDE